MFLRLCKEGENKRMPQDAVSEKTFGGHILAEFNTQCAFSLGTVILFDKVGSICCL